MVLAPAPSSYGGRVGALPPRWKYEISEPEDCARGPLGASWGSD